MFIAVALGGTAGRSAPRYTAKGLSPAEKRLWCRSLPLGSSGTAPSVPLCAESLFQARCKNVRLEVRSKYWPWISALFSPGEAREVERSPSPALPVEDSRPARASLRGGCSRTALCSYAGGGVGGRPRR